MAIWWVDFNTKKSGDGKSVDQAFKTIAEAIVAVKSCKDQIWVINVEGNNAL